MARTQPSCAGGRPLTTTAALRAEPVVQAELVDGTTTLKQ
jgi:hypothetical protein